MKKKIFSLLVLLMTAVTGAWANTTVNFENGVVPTDWNNSDTYPWVIADGNGGKCLKSSNSGVHSSTSEISVTVTYDENGTIEFDAECCGEGTSNVYDKCQFFIDGAEQFTYGSQVSGWNHYSYNITAGEHTFKWSYKKDASVSPTGDYMAIDNVVINNGEGGYALIKAEDAEAHGTIQFNVGEDENLKEDVSSAKEGDLVTVIITPDDGYLVNEATGKWLAAETKAPRRTSIDMKEDIDLQFVSEDETTHAKTYTFQMIRANAEIGWSYNKLMTNGDITIDPIPDQTYTGETLTPVVVVKDGETTLVSGIHYNVTFFENINVGTATVIIYAIEGSGYSGSVQATFTIVSGSTGIADINREATVTNNRYYDLQGRRISVPTKGLYIVNGKKVIVK